MSSWADIVVTGGTVNCHNEIFQYHQWWQSWHNDNPRFTVYIWLWKLHQLTLVIFDFDQNVWIIRALISMIIRLISVIKGPLGSVSMSDIERLIVRSHSVSNRRDSEVKCPYRIFFFFLAAILLRRHPNISFDINILMSVMLYRII